jgi:hypothetical protein
MIKGGRVFRERGVSAAIGKVGLELGRANNPQSRLCINTDQFRTAPKWRDVQKLIKAQRSTVRLGGPLEGRPDSPGVRRT